MATGDAVDFKWYRYTCDDGTYRSVKVDKTWGDNADSGLAAFETTDAPMVTSRSQRPRTLLFQEPVSGRQTTRIAGTVTCDAWIEAGYPSVQKFRGLLLAIPVIKIDQRGEHIRRARVITPKAEPISA